MPQLVIDIGRVGDRRCHFGAEQFAVALTHLVEQSLDFRLLHSEFPGHYGIRNLLAVGREGTAQHIENSAPAVAFAFSLKAAQGLFRKGRRPAHIEEHLCRPALDRRLRDGQLGRRLRRPFVPRDKLNMAAPLLRLLSVLNVGQEIAKRGEQERTKSPACAIGAFQKVSVQNHDEKILCQILCIGNAESFTADEGKNGPPINAADLRERVGGLAIVRCRVERRSNNAPMGRVKTTAWLSVLRWGAGRHARP